MLLTAAWPFGIERHSSRMTLGVSQSVQQLQDCQGCMHMLATNSYIDCASTTTTESHDTRAINMAETAPPMRRRLTLVLNRSWTSTSTRDQLLLSIDQYCRDSATLRFAVEDDAIPGKRVVLQRWANFSKVGWTRRHETSKAGTFLFASYGL